MSLQTGGRGRAALFLVLALVVAATASFAVYRILEESRSQLADARRPAETFPVILATRDLSMGIPIGMDDVMVRMVLPDMIPPEVTFSTLEEVVGRTPRERILVNEMVRSERLARRDAGIGLNALITPGKRAMSFQTSTTTNVAGFIRPGNFVDVLVSIAPALEELDADFITQTILQQVKVLAVGSTLERSDGDKKTQQPPQNSLTVELTLEESEKLALAMSKGTLNVVLRSDVDIEQRPDGRRVDMGDVLHVQESDMEPQPRVIWRRAPEPEKEESFPEVIIGSETKKVDPRSFDGR